MTRAKADGKELLRKPIGGFPDVFDNTLLWSGKHIPSDSYIVSLQADEVAEVDNALQAFKQLELDGDEVSKTTFPLPILQNRLRKVAIDLHHGKGFSLLRGLEPSQYSVEDLLLIYLGISSYIGDKRGVQNRKGDMLTHILDSNDWTIPHEFRHGIHTNQDLPFHSDMGASILAIQYRQCAFQGGETLLASASTIYNDLLQNSSDALATLVKPDWPIQVSSNPPRYILAPLIQYHDDHVLLSFDPGRLGIQQASRPIHNESDTSGVPSLNSTQVQALEILSKVARDHCVKIAAQPGDMLFLNNWALVHGRDSYKDDHAHSTRHLVRLWLHNTELGWKIPTNMMIPWLAAFGSAEGTEASEDHNPLKSLNRNYPVLPTKEYKVPKYTAGSAAFLLEDSDDDEV